MGVIKSRTDRWNKFIDIIILMLSFSLVYLWSYYSNHHYILAVKLALFYLPMFVTGFFYAKYGIYMNNYTKTNSIVFRFRGFADYGTDTINCTFNVEINTSNEITCTLTDGYIIRELTKTATVAAESNETITFDTLSISVFSKYTILEYGEKYQNKIWVGPQFVGTSPMCLPYLTDESTASNLNLKARVYNPVTSGAIDVTAYAKVLLEL